MKVYHQNVVRRDVFDLLDEEQVQWAKFVALNMLLDDEEKVVVAVLSMTYVVEMLEEYLVAHWDDCRDAFDHLYYLVMTKAVVVAVVDSMEEVAYVDC